MNRSNTKEISKQLLQRLSHPSHSAASGEQALRTIFDYVLTNAKSINGSNFNTISASDLGLLFQITDEYFFDGLVGSLCERKSSRPLSFRLSTRMTHSGGMTTMQSVGRKKNRKLQFEIAIATTPLFSSFKEKEISRVGGRTCTSRLEALQRIMEHEMIHLVEMLLWDDSNCSATRFKKIVRNFFGHTESNHQLLTPRDIARKRLGIAPGDIVTFRRGNDELIGHVNAITKRATVLVKDAKGTLYNDGHRYHKFYVPLNHLKKRA